MVDNSSAERIAELRRQFPGTERWIYLDVAARGILSNNVRAAVEAHLEARALDGGDKEFMLEQVEGARHRFAKFINAAPDEISLTKNTSDGINAFAHSIHWRPGDNIVICEALEHPANVFSWRNLRDIHGVDLKLVPPRNGRIPMDRLLAAMDDRTRVVTVSSVSFSPGRRFPIRELSAECRKRDVLIIVDASQSVGILKTDVVCLGIDALATATQKGLLGLYGAGFLFVRRELAESLRPIYLSRSGISVSSKHEASSGDPENFTLAPGARRFDVGNPNIIAAVAVERSLTDLELVGSGAVERHCCSLAQRLSEELRDLGLPVFADASDADGAHIVALGEALTDEHDRANDRNVAAFSQFLLDNRVRHTIRRGMLRLSFHVYNNDEDVQAVAALARQWVKQERAPPARSGRLPG